MCGESDESGVARLQNLLRRFCKRSIQKSVFSVQKFHRPGGSVSECARQAVFRATPLFHTIPTPTPIHTPTHTHILTYSNTHILTHPHTHCGLVWIGLARVILKKAIGI